MSQKITFTYSRIKQKLLLDRFETKNKVVQWLSTKSSKYFNDGFRKVEKRRKKKRCEKYMTLDNGNIGKS